ncbi:MAG: purine nucleoside permease, partial [Spirochaetia bacterium]|nr:purine nucleoside permease [Spirochaetia bacterium]
MKHMNRLLMVATLLLAALVALSAQPVAEKQEVKVLVLGMFEVGENKGDFAGEFQHFYEAYFDGAASYELNSLPLT